MTVYTYTGKLTDFGQAPFPDANPRLWVEPTISAYGPDGVLSPKRIPVSVDSSGEFSIDLVASADTSPAVTYMLRCEWLDADTVIGWTGWEFTAVVGGGGIQGMADAPASVWWVGPPWPPGTPSGFYLDRFTNDVGRK